MSQKRNILISCVICCLILIIVVGIERWVGTEQSASTAENYEQLQLHIKFASGTEKINIWQSEEGYYYFFLPTNAKDEKIVFGNLHKDDSIRLGGQTYQRKDDLVEEIQYGVPYEMQLCVEGKQLDKQRIIFLRSENLPAVFINTSSGNVDSIHSDKTIKEEASLRVVNSEGNTEFDNDIQYIKTRGNSTFAETDKKSYQIKLFNKKSLLGMKSAEKWILLANAIDDSLVRNRLVYDFATQYTQIPSIQGQYIDLYLNGDYVGNYYLCEKIEVSEERVNITDLEERNEAINSKDNLENGTQYVSEDEKIRAVEGLKNPDDITGGYLLEKIGNGEYNTIRSGFITESGQCYSVISPENATIEQVQYICNLFNEFEVAINQPDGINPDTGKRFSEYMDMDSWTSKYLIEEAFDDPDAPVASIYFYKDSDSVDPLIYAGPMWDYDRTMGGYGVNATYVDDPLGIGYNGAYARKLLQYEDVYQAVIEKYKDWFVPYVENKVHNDINSIRSEIAASAGMDDIRWPQTAGYYSEMDANDKYIEEFLQRKVDYLNDVWLEAEQYHTVTFLDYYGNVYNRYTIKDGEYLFETPNISAYSSIFAGWYSTTSGQPFDARLPILEDVTYESRWIEMDILLQNGLAIAEMDASQIDVHTLEMLVDGIKKQQEEQGIE